MPLTSDRILPRIAVRLWPNGGADPRPSPRGFGWYDNLKESHEGGLYEYDAGGVYLTEYAPDIGVSLLPRLILKDTRFTHFSFAGDGLWEERLPSTGSPRTYRLWQFSTDPDVAYEATSADTIPVGRDFAVTLDLDDSPPEWDSDDFPPYVQVQWGDGGAYTTWAVKFERAKATFRVWTGTEFQDLKRLSGGRGYGGDVDEQILWVRHMRGRVLVSLNSGESYVGAGTDVFPAYAGAGPLVITGQGGSAGFGFHQLWMGAGRYHSIINDTLTSRVLPEVAMFPWSYSTPGGDIDFTDLADHAAGLVQYEALLTPGSSSLATSGWTIYGSPVLGSVNYVIYPVEVEPGDIDPEEPFDLRILNCRVNKAEEMTEGTATLSVALLPGETVLEDNYKFRKLQIDLGYRVGDAPGVDHLNTVFTGYIRKVTTGASAWGQATLELEAGNVLEHLRTRDWDPLEIVAFDGLTINDALDYILRTEAIPRNTSWRIWHAWGDVTTIDVGTPEKPCELVRPGETKAETVERLLSFARLTLAVSDDGILEALPPNYNTGTTWEFEAVSQDLEKMVLGVTQAVDYTKSATMIIVTGEDLGGNRIMAYFRDGEAEDTPVSDRFSPWRVTHHDEVSGASSVEMLMARAQLLGWKYFGTFKEPTIQVHLNTAISRADLATLNGLDEDGIPDATDHLVIAMDHDYTQGQSGDVNLVTKIGMRRI